MNVVFRIDASKDNGIGHLFRCKNLASSLINRGAKVHFIMRYFDTEFRKFLKLRKENKKIKKKLALYHYQV